MGSVILDFYCPSARLAVEIDGSTHWEDAARDKDQARDRWLAGQGVAVLRIPASAVYRDLGHVAGVVLLRAEELLRACRPAPGLSPSTTRSAARGPPPAAARGR